MQTAKFVYWEENGAWIGYFQEFPWVIEDQSVLEFRCEIAFLIVGGNDDANSRFECAPLPRSRSYCAN